MEKFSSPLKYIFGSAASSREFKKYAEACSNKNASEEDAKNIRKDFEHAIEKSNWSINE